MTDREQLELAARAAVELKNRQYAADPLLWCMEQVQTQDEATQQLLRFPVDKVYLEDLFHVLQTKQMVAIPKSRRMFVSWAISMYFLHKIRFFPHWNVYWQSLTEEKAAYIVDQRCRLVEDHIDPLFQKPYKAIRTKTGSVGKLTFLESQSYMLAIPQGDDQIRSLTPSALVMDECDFQPEAHKALKAALSTVEKKSQIILVSTSDGPGLPLANICKDIGFLRFQ